MDQLPGETVREWVERGATICNLPPCSPETCGIDGVPCPRCQVKWFESLVDQAERKEKQRLMREIEEFAS